MGINRAFVPVLESLRGVAALAVAIFHALHILPIGGNDQVFQMTIRSFDTWQQLAMRILMVPFNGGAAVSLFFVLSGYVLTLSLDRDARAPSFIRRRFIRIYPALAGSIVVTGCVAWALNALGVPVNVPWFQISVKDVLENIALIGTKVNGPSWSLIVELIAVPFIYVVYVLSRRLGRGAIIGSVVIAIVVVFSPKLGLRTVAAPYLFMFFLGMLAARAGQFFANLSGLSAAMTLAAVTALMLGGRFAFGYSSPWALVSEAVGASAIIAILGTGPRLWLHALLERPLFRSLGRISYSFYLYHALALGIVLEIILFFSPSALQSMPWTTALLLSLGTVAMTVPMALVSFHLIEMPTLSPRSRDAPEEGLPQGWRFR